MFQKRIHRVSLFKYSCKGSWSEPNNKMDLNIDSFSVPEPKNKGHQGISYKYKLDELNLGLILFQCMKKYSSRILQYISDTEEVDTYGDVLSRSIRTALTLKEKGITRSDIISTCTHNHKNTVVPVIATLLVGAKTANFDPNLSHLDTIHLLKLIQPKIIFVSEESVTFMEKCLKESEVNTELVVFGYSEKYPQFSEYLQPNDKEETFVPVSVDDNKETSVILFSSGTSGLPKGICLSHYSLLGQTVDDRFLMGNETPPCVMLVYTTFYWVSAFTFLLRCVLMGNSRVICSKFNALNTWKLIEKYKVGLLFLAPYHATQFLLYRDKNIKVDSLFCLITGSTSVTKQLMVDLKEALPNTIILQGYGQTEIAGFCTMFDLGKAGDIEMQIRKPQSCGKIMQGLQWKVVDPSTEEILGPNQRGELRIKSDFAMNGYYKMDSSSAFDSEGFLKTGDIVYYDEDGCFYVVDRIKEIFKYKGWHIVPAVLEEVLLQHPAVKEAVVIGISHEIDGEHPMGIVVLNAGYEDVTPGDIERYMDEKVPDIQRLRAGVKFVTEIPRTTTEKVKRRDMKQMVMDGLI